jgi:hypothetical protein
MGKKTPQNELSRLQTEIQGLRATVAKLEREILDGERGLQQAIKARGMQVYRQNPEAGLIFTPGTSPEERTILYQLLRCYSFRLFLRDVISKKESFREEDLTRYCSLAVARRYIASLCDLKLAEGMGKGSYRLLQHSLCSFGPTLEWFVAQIFHREFASPAIYGVRFRGTHSGGDYDVIAHWEGQVVYMEIKSSPPRGIERREIGSFLARIADLLPDIAFFFNDTQLRMKDKIIFMFEEELYERYGHRSRALFPVHNMDNELFHINHRLYIVNSKKDAVDNINRCLRDFLSYHRCGLFPLAPHSPR